MRPCNMNFNTVEKQKVVILVQCLCNYTAYMHIRTPTFPTSSSDPEKTKLGVMTMVETGKIDD